MGHPCIAVFAAFLVTAPFSNGPAWAERSREDDQHRASGRGDSLVLQWNEVALEAIRRSTLGPPIVARALAIVHTCIYDAWAAYDPMARGTQLGVSLRQPPHERKANHKREALSLPAIARSLICFRRSRRCSTT